MHEMCTNSVNQVIGSCSQIKGAPTPSTFRRLRTQIAVKGPALPNEQRCGIAGDDRLLSIFHLVDNKGEQQQKIRRKNGIRHQKKECREKIPPECVPACIRAYISLVHNLA